MSHKKERNHYSVKELADLSDVSVRTLHWYDNIGLLKPAYIGVNNYRYYEEEQLLQLQQILFFKELGFPLKAIEPILKSEGFDKLRALRTHKENLKALIDQKKTLLKTVDKTIKHLKEGQIMKEKEYYNGFDHTKQGQYEQYIVKYHGTVAEDLILESKKRTQAWKKKDWESVNQEGEAIYTALTDCIDNDISYKDAAVQEQIQKHFDMTNRFYEVTKDVYIGLSQMYCEHPDFVKYFDKYHPKLAEYIANAMRYYAKEQLN